METSPKFISPFIQIRRVWMSGEMNSGEVKPPLSKQEKKMAHIKSTQIQNFLFFKKRLKSNILYPLNDKKILFLQKKKKKESK